MSEPIFPLRQWPPGIQQASVPANDNALREEAVKRPALGVANDASGSDADGDMWIVGDTPAGAFATFEENDVALYQFGSWYAWAPTDGLRLIVNDVPKIYVGGSTNAWQNDTSDGISDAPSDGSTYGRKDGAWEVVAGSGDVTGPASSTDGHLVVFDGVTGKAVRDGGAPLTNPMTTAGDIITGGTSGAAQRLAVGSEGQVVKVVSGAVAWADESGGGGGGAVSSVNGDTGAVVLTEGDIVAGINAQTGTTYTAALTDEVVTMDNSSANTLTIPPNSSVAFPVGCALEVWQKGTGQTTIAAGSGVTILYHSANTLKLQGQNSGCSLRKVATDTWRLIGDMEQV